jgi:hypothetical protein
MTNSEAPYCDACGGEFPYAAPPSLSRNHPATWKGRLVAVACGLLVAAFVHIMHT